MPLYLTNFPVWKEKKMAVISPTTPSRLPLNQLGISVSTLFIPIAHSPFVPATIRLLWCCLWCSPLFIFMKVSPCRGVSDVLPKRVFPPCTSEKRIQETPFFLGPRVDGVGLFVSPLGLQEAGCLLGKTSACNCDSFNKHKPLHCTIKSSNVSALSLIVSPPVCLYHITTGQGNSHTWRECHSWINLKKKNKNKCINRN